MTIRLKILAACAVFLALNLFMAMFFHHEESRLGALALRIYDEAFQGQNYAHRAQADLIRLIAMRQGRRDPLNQDEKAQLDVLSDNLEIAGQRAMSDKGRDFAKQVQGKVAGLSLNPDPAALDQIDGVMRRMVDRYVADGFTYRKGAEILVGESRQTLFAVAGAALVTAALTALLLLRAIVPPLRNAVSMASAIADGKLDNAIAAKGRSETAVLLRALSAMQQAISDNLRHIAEQRRRAEAQAEIDQERKQTLEELTRKFEAKIAKLLETVEAATHSARQSADSLAQDANAAERSMQSAIKETTETSVAVSAIASAAEQISAFIQDISQKVTHSAGMAQSAVTKAQAVDEITQRLADAAGRIVEFTSVIGAISAQTNLLALNATIEAARAGESGKGFAVVAGEVKNLAAKTADAAKQIAGQVEEIQAVTERMLEGLGAIRQSIDEMGGVSSFIASSVREQGSATEEITQNIRTSSAKIEAASANIRSSRSINDNSHQVVESVTTFSSLYQSLTEEIEGFLKSVA
jgi:methyl-accepting chemotaxis protein